MCCAARVVHIPVHKYGIFQPTLPPCLRLLPIASFRFDSFVGRPLKLSRSLAMLLRPFLSRRSPHECARDSGGSPDTLLLELKAAADDRSLSGRVADRPASDQD